MVRDVHQFDSCVVINETPKGQSTLSEPKDVSLLRLPVDYHWLADSCWLCPHWETLILVHVVCLWGTPFGSSRSVQSKRLQWLVVQMLFTVVWRRRHAFSCSTFYFNCEQTKLVPKNIPNTPNSFRKINETTNKYVLTAAWRNRIVIYIRSCSNSNIVNGGSTKVARSHYSFFDVCRQQSGTADLAHTI